MRDSFGSENQQRDVVVQVASAEIDNRFDDSVLQRFGAELSRLDEQVDQARLTVLFSHWIARFSNPVREHQEPISRTDAGLALFVRAIFYRTQDESPAV